MVVDLVGVGSAVRSWLLHALLLVGCFRPYLWAKAFSALPLMAIGDRHASRYLSPLGQIVMCPRAFLHHYTYDREHVCYGLADTRVLRFVGA